MKILAAFLAGGIFAIGAAFAGFHLLAWKANMR